MFAHIITHTIILLIKQFFHNKNCIYPYCFNYTLVQKFSYFLTFMNVNKGSHTDASYKFIVEQHWEVGGWWYKAWILENISEDLSTHWPRFAKVINKYKYCMLMDDSEHGRWIVTANLHVNRVGKKHYKT
jgi:hypothetical protein